MPETCPEGPRFPWLALHFTANHTTPTARNTGRAYAETLVFRRKAMLEATEPLMSENGIPRWGSDDVLAV